MKTRDQVQRAHDVLAAIVLGEVPVPTDRGLGMSPERIQRDLAFCLNVLCWVLEHSHNSKFADFLNAHEAWLASRGYVLERGPL